MIECIRPVQQIVGVCDRHLCPLVYPVGEIIHPVFSTNFFGNDGSGLGPTHIPFAFVSRHDYALSFPMNKIVGRCHAQLSVPMDWPYGMCTTADLIVVAGVGEVKNV